MPKIFEYQSIAAYLQAVFTSRSLTNDRYSMRAFARDLDLSPSRLSEVLRGMGELSPDGLSRIAGILSLDQYEREYGQLLIRLSKTSSETHKTTLLNELRRIRFEHSFKQAAPEQLFGLSELDWEDLLVYFLISTQPDKELVSIGKQLSWEQSRLNLSLEKLQSLKLLQLQDDRWQPTAANHHFGDSGSQSAVRAFHRMYLHLAERALSDIPIDRRWFRSVFFTAKCSDYDQIVEALQTVVLSETDRFDDETDHDQIFALGLQLVPVSDI